MKRYQIITSDDSLTLSEKVEEMIKIGWMTQGGVALAVEHGERYENKDGWHTAPPNYTYAQAMRHDG